MKNYNNLIHPEEKNTLSKLNTAIDTIENISGVKDIIQSVSPSNDSDYGFCVANYIQAGKIQYSDVYAILEELCKEINISKPNLFIKSDNKFEHFTIGKAPYNIVLSSGLVNLLDNEGLMVVLAHECGHIKFNHVQYTNMLQHFDALKSVIPLKMDIVLTPFISKFVEWCRVSDYTADRITADIMKDDYVVVKTFIKLSRGDDFEISNEQIKEFIAQGKNAKREANNQSLINKMIDALKNSTYAEASNFTIRAYELSSWFSVEGNNTHSSTGVKHRKFIWN